MLTHPYMCVCLVVRLEEVIILPFILIAFVRALAYYSKLAIYLILCGGSFYSTTYTMSTSIARAKAACVQTIAPRNSYV